ncbi:hypothetical protein AT05_10470 [Schleiferia thermophila str. Yellowstone]|nr:hypothetical protein AT05_10470 [Schleiferia thermophila str. Yellowstone]
MEIEIFGEEMWEKPNSVKVCCDTDVRPVYGYFA